MGKTRAKMQRIKVRCQGEVEGHQHNGMMIFVLNLNVFMLIENNIYFGQVEKTKIRKVEIKTKGLKELKVRDIYKTIISKCTVKVEIRHVVNCTN